MSNAPTTTRPEVRMSESTGGPALAQRLRITPDTLDATVRASYRELYAAAGAGPLTLDRPAYLRYHGVDDEGAEIEIEACLPFAGDAAQPGELLDGMYRLDELAGPRVSAVVTGSDAEPPRIMRAYDAVAEWIVRHGFDFAGPATETFLRWLGQPGHPQNRLEVGWAVRTEPDAEVALD